MVKLVFLQFTTVYHGLQAVSETKHPYGVSDYFIKILYPQMKSNQIKSNCSLFSYVQVLHWHTECRSSTNNRLLLDDSFNYLSKKFMETKDLSRKDSSTNKNTGNETQESPQVLWCYFTKVHGYNTERNTCRNKWEKTQHWYDQLEFSRKLWDLVFFIVIFHI